MSPASTPSAEALAEAEATLADLGLVVEVGAHATDRLGYLAGRDEDRLDDFNQALRDPGVRAVIATRGGKGAYRIAAGLDVEAVKKDPKLIVGFSEITVIHLFLLRACGLVGLHGAPWNAKTHGEASAASFVSAAFQSAPIALASDPDEPTAVLTTSGAASGPLIGGNQDLVAIASGWALPPLDGAILLLEAYNLRLGHIDRQLTMLKNSGALDGIVGVAVGQYTDCGTDALTQGDWTEIDVLSDRLSLLGVPVLGGLPIGHGVGPRAVPLGTTATIDADLGTLVVAPAVS